MQAIQKFNFHGDVLEVVQKQQDLYISIRRVCEALGVDYSGQLQKLKNKRWACVETIPTHDETGRSQEMAMLHLDGLAMWLATIEASRVNRGVRPKLERYQVECARVLRDHFFGKPAATRDDGVINKLVGLVQQTMEMVANQNAQMMQFLSGNPNAGTVREASSDVQRAVRDAVERIITASKEGEGRRLTFCGAQSRALKRARLSVNTYLAIPTTKIPDFIAAADTVAYLVSEKGRSEQSQRRLIEAAMKFGDN